MQKLTKKQILPKQNEALPGREERMPIPELHFVTEKPLDDDFDGMSIIVFGMGCFWGAERKFWQQKGVVSTAVGYMGGFTQNPTYQEVCSGLTGHNEVVRVVFDPNETTLSKLLQLFWENHDPTQVMRQGNDVGTQYRSGIYCFDTTDLSLAEASKKAYQKELEKAGYGTIATEILPASAFYFAEEYHQQYLAKNPNGYCGLGGVGVTCPIGLTR